jgi:cobalt-zinc-cadmium efflux system membrane fusion protein
MTSLARVAAASATAMAGAALLAATPGAALLATAAGAALLVATPGCTRTGGDDEPAGRVEGAPGVALDPAAAKNARIGLAKAGPAHLSPALSFVGDLTLLPGRRAKVPTVVTGVVQRVLVQEGDPVQRGQRLAVLESRELGEAALKLLRARHRLEVAQEALKREEALHAKGIAPTEALQARKHAEKHARLELRTARARLDVLGLTPAAVRRLGARGAGRLARLTLRAPLRGRVVSVAAVAGASVASGVELFEVADLTRLQVVFSVPAGDLPAVKPSARVRVHVADLGSTVTGRVTGVGPVVDTASRAARARAEVDNAAGRLSPGLSAEVRLVAGRLPVRLAVPASAVHEVSGERVVFVQEARGRFRPVTVRVGRSDKALVEITKGLRGGETVATDNSLVLKTVKGR